MVFTSTVFLGVFLPLLLGVYFLANTKARPYVLLVFSLLFYAWGEPSAVVIMLALMVFNYFLALGMTAARERKWFSATLLGVGVCADIGALVAYATDPATTPYQPMHVNFGIVPPLDGPRMKKRERYQAYADRAERDLASYLESRPDLFQAAPSC